MARRARGAVAVLFFTNGALFANVVPRYPDLKAELGLSNAALGSAVAAYGLGALVGNLGLGTGLIYLAWVLLGYAVRTAQPVPVLRQSPA